MNTETRIVCDIVFLFTVRLNERRSIVKKKLTAVNN